MKIRADVAELLRAGHSDRAIARQLNVDVKTTVAPARAMLGLPKARPGKTPAASPEDLFWRRVKPTDDGHMEWTGSLSAGYIPSLRHGGRCLSAYRIAYRIANGREPEGNTLPSCGRARCVKPGHHRDRQDRAEQRRQFAARGASLYNGGATVHEVARDLGVSYGMAHALLVEAGVTLRRPGRYDRAKVREQHIDALYAGIFGASA